MDRRKFLAGTASVAAAAAFTALMCMRIRLHLREFHPYPTQLVAVHAFALIIRAFPSSLGSGCFGFAIAHPFVPQGQAATHP